MCRWEINTLVLRLPNYVNENRTPVEKDETLPRVAENSIKKVASCFLMSLAMAQW